MHILAAVAQFERELIRERVSAGMRAAKTHGTKTGNAIGRPRRVFDREEVVRLSHGWPLIEKIAGQMRIGVGTVVRVLEAVGATSHHADLSEFRTKRLSGLRPGAGSREAAGLSTLSTATPCHLRLNFKRP